MEKIRIIITGGTFDKHYDELAAVQQAELEGVHLVLDDLPVPGSVLQDRADEPVTQLQVVGMGAVPAVLHLQPAVVQVPAA